MIHKISCLGSPSLQAVFPSLFKIFTCGLGKLTAKYQTEEDALSFSEAKIPLILKSPEKRMASLEKKHGKPTAGKYLQAGRMLCLFLGLSVKPKNLPCIMHM